MSAPFLKGQGNDLERARDKERHRNVLTTVIFQPLLSCEKGK